MAKAYQNKKIVEKVIQQVVKEEIKDGITLELSDIEAKCVFLALCQCTGNAPYQVFKVIQNIYGRIDLDFPELFKGGTTIPIHFIENAL